MSYKAPSPPEKLAVALAFRELAGWPKPVLGPPPVETRTPLLFVKTDFDEPLESATKRLVHAHSRDVVVVQVETRPHLPTLTLAMARADREYISVYGHEPWLARNGRTLWASSPLEPHPPLPLFVFTPDGIVEATSPPWTDARDRRHGCEHARLAFSRLLEAPRG